jgi:hypothetical protein
MTDNSNAAKEEEPKFQIRAPAKKTSKSLWKKLKKMGKLRKGTERASLSNFKATGAELVKPDQTSINFSSTNFDPVNNLFNCVFDVINCFFVAIKQLCKAILIFIEYSHTFML